MSPHDECFKSNEALETVIIRKIKVAVPQKMGERWGQEEEWSERRRQMMLFQDQGGLIMMVLLCSLAHALALSLSIYLLFLILLIGSIGPVGSALQQKLQSHFHKFPKKKWQPLASFYNSEGIKC